MKCAKCGKELGSAVPIYTKRHYAHPDSINLCEKHFKEYSCWVEAFIANETPDVIYNLKGAIDAALCSLERRERKPNHLTLSGADYCELKQEYNAGPHKMMGLPIDVDTTLLKGVFRISWKMDYTLFFPQANCETFVYIG